MWSKIFLFVVRTLVFGALFLSTAFPARAVERNLRISAPTAAAAEKDVEITLSASTDAGKGERIGFLHAESSIDGGKSWAALCYLDNSGATVLRVFTVKAGAPGSKLFVRVRAAFRGGLAGDVDYNGAAIRWKDTWEDWGQPPAKIATVVIR